MNGDLMMQLNKLMVEDDYANFCQLFDEMEIMILEDINKNNKISFIITKIGAKKPHENGKFNTVLQCKYGLTKELHDELIKYNRHYVRILGTPPGVEKMHKGYFYQIRSSFFETTNMRNQMLQFAYYRWRTPTKYGFKND